MGTDEVATTFAAWVTAHKAHVDAQKRLLAAQGMGKELAMRPPQQLIDEVEALRRQDVRLLAIANAALARSREG